jgi:hypothetical protein
VFEVILDHQSQFIFTKKGENEPKTSHLQVYSVGEETEVRRRSHAVCLSSALEMISWIFMTTSEQIERNFVEIFRNIDETNISSKVERKQEVLAKICGNF